MSCRRAYDIDLAAFLADPRDPAHGDFREHYPRCAACAAEVRAWSEVEGLLRPPEAHPAPEKLLAFEEDRDSLAPVERAALEEHVSQCASCRDELAALRGFEPGPAKAPAPARGSALGALLAGLRSLLVQPAFAYGLALLFAAPTLYRLVTSESELLREAPLERAADAPEAQVLHELQAARKAQVEPAAPELAARSRSAAEPRDERSQPRAQVVEQERKDDSAAANTLQRKAPARAKVSGVLHDEMEEDAPVPESVPFSEMKQEQLRGLGHSNAPRRSAPSARATVGEGAEAAGEMRSAEKAPPQAPVAGSFAAEVSRSADTAVATDSLKMHASEPAAPPLPILEPSGPGVYRLRVPLEPGMREVEVRVSPPGGGRMLAEHFRAAADEVTLEIPAAWVVPGTWRIERRAFGRRDVFELEVP